MLRRGLVPGSRDVPGLLDKGLLPGVFGVPPAGTIAATHLTTAGSTADATSFATASISPSAEAVQYLGVVSQIAGGPAAPTVTGCGLTWVQEETQTLGATRRVTVFRAHGTPTAGALTIDFGAATQASLAYSVVEFPGADLGGTSGSHATRQSVPATASAATTITSTLAALESPRSVHLCFTALVINSAITVGTDFAELGQAGAASAALRIQSAWKVNDTTCDPTFPSADVATISIEVKAA